MSDKLVEVAEFGRSLEAHVAHGLLEAEGIRAVLSGEAAVNIFGGVPAGGKITLHVAESDAERAVGILAAAEADRADEEDRPPSENDPVWICPVCGDAVADRLPACLACGTPRPEGLKSTAVMAALPSAPPTHDIQQTPTERTGRVTADTPLEAVPSAAEDDLDVPDAETFIGDDLVRRAFISSLFGFLFPYSLWLLARVAFYPGKISPKMMPRLYLTIAIDAWWCLLLFLTCGFLLHPLF
jgi:hypothetical protein